MKRKVYAIIVALVVAVAAQGGIPDMKFMRLDTRDGLSNSSIMSILRDSRGFVWIGTPYGLNRYDGYRFRTFYSDAKDTMTLRNNYVDEIYEATDGKLWVRQGMNYSVFDPATERGDRHPERLLEKMGMHGGIERMYIDRDGDFWVKTYDEGFWHLKANGKKTHRYNFGYGNDEFNSDAAVSGFAETDKMMYVVSNNGEIFCFDKQKDRILWKNQYLRQTQGVSNQDCKPRVDAQGNLWVITTERVFILNKARNHWFHSATEAMKAWGYEGVPDEISVWDVRMDKDGCYWLATDHGGLYVMDPKEKVIRQFLNNKFDESTLSDNTLRIIYRDQLDRMWIGTYMNGINLYTGAASGFLNLELGNINTVCVDKQGYWWLGSNETGIMRYDPRTQEQTCYTRENSGFRSNIMVGSLAASDGSVWFGTYEGGLIHIKNGHVTNITATGDTLGLNNNNIWTLYEDQWGNIWLGELGGGVQRIDKRTGRMVSVRMDNSIIPSDYINTISRSKKGWLLVAHSNYFSLIHPKTRKVINLNASKNIEELVVNESSITGLEDSRGLIWQGSSSGAFIWDMKTNHGYLLDMKSGLFGSTVNGIIEDNKHTIWMATDHGVTNVIPQKQDDGTWHFVVRSYNNRDGLQNGPYNQRSMCYTADGLILIGGQGGLDVINPKNLGKGRMKERPLFSGLQIFDRDVAVGEKIDGRVILTKALDECREVSLRFNDQFTIQMGSSSGEVHNRSRFVYKLEGFNDNWVRTSELNPNITYNSLRAGDYVLHVRMLKDDGTFGEEESLLKIEIRPPFWRSRWMLLLYLVLLLFAAWRWRKWLSKRHEQRLRAEALRHEVEKQQWMSEVRMQIAMEGIKKKGNVNDNDNDNDNVNDDGNDDGNSTPDSRPSTLQLTKADVDLVALLNKTCKNFSVSPEGLNAEVTCRSMVEQLEASIDKEQLVKALNILLSNSVKFSAGDCQINVNIGRVGADKAVIQVADNGIGIRDEYKAGAFEPVLGGEGIGLDKVKNIVVAHGGSIRLEDNPGGGTIFTITLPARKEIVVEDAVMLDDEE